MNLLIIDAGGHGQVVRELASSTGKFEKIDFLDDNSDLAIGKLNEIKKYRVEYEAVFIAIGNPKLRHELMELVSSYEYQIPTIIHSNAYVSSSCSIGKGTVVMPGAIIQANSKIGNGCIISVGAIIDHDASVGDYCHVNAGAIVSSMRTVPDETKIDYGKIF